MSINWHGTEGIPRGVTNVGAMRRRSRTVGAALTVAVVAAGVAGCGAEGVPAESSSTETASSSAEDFAVSLMDRVSTDAMMAHLKKLQDIADAHGGNRALGTPGYDAS